HAADPQGEAAAPASQDDAEVLPPPTGPSALALLKESAAPRILEVHRRLVAVRRRHSWLADASVVVRQASLENAYAELVLTPPADAGDAHAGDADAPVGPLVLAVNLSAEDRPVGGEILEAVSGADVLDAVGAPAPGVGAAHRLAVPRCRATRLCDRAGWAGAGADTAAGGSARAPGMMVSMAPAIHLGEMPLADRYRRFARREARGVSLV